MSKKRHGAPGPTPLVVIAGLPIMTAEIAAATITNSRDRWRAVANAFTQRDDNIYGQPSTITDLMRQTCDIALADSKDEEGVPSPSRIVLAYVAGAGSDRLWEAFGHSVWPIALDHPDWDWRGGRHWRSEIEVVNLLLSRALKLAKGETAEGMRLRLEARRTDDVLLLPGRNFHLKGDGRLVSRFRAFMQGELDGTQVEDGIKVERFSFERLPAFYSRVGGRGKKFAVDARGLVFAKSEHGQHGGHHSTPRNATPTQAFFRKELERVVS
jgi:hypothetical protein